MRSEIMFVSVFRNQACHCGRRTCVPMLSGRARMTIRSGATHAEHADPGPRMLMWFVRQCIPVRKGRPRMLMRFGKTHKQCGPKPGSQTKKSTQEWVRHTWSLCAHLDAGFPAKLGPDGLLRQARVYLTSVNRLRRACSQGVAKRPTLCNRTLGGLRLFD